MRLATFVLVCVLLALAGCREPMFSRLTEQDANEIIAVLRDHGIRAVKVAGAEQTWGLDVGSEDFSRAVHVLHENGLPRTMHASIGELFRKEGLVSTPTEERIRFVFAQQQELENTLSRIDGVIAARVHVVIPQNDPLSDKPKAASASIFIKHRSDVDLTASVSQIKALVARSIEGLPHENVSLSMFPSRGLAAPAAPADDTRSTPSLSVAWAVGGAVLGALALLLAIWAGSRTGRSFLRQRAGPAVTSAKPVLRPVAGTPRRDAPVPPKTGSV